MLGTNNKDRTIGIFILTSKSLKKLISSNKFIMKPKLKKIILVLIIVFINLI